MPRALKSKEREQLVEELHALGLRATPARVGVLAAIRSVASPVTSAELADLVRNHGWDAATVYRNLMTLVDAGVVTRSDLGDRRWRFAAATHGANRHPHFVCTDCGAVSCLHDVKVEMAESANLPRYLQSEHVEVQVRGVCDECFPE